MAGFVVPGVSPLSEWPAQIVKGVIDTCVSTAENVITAAYGVLPESTNNVLRLAEDQIAHGEATPRGATFVGGASAQLRRLGIANTDYEGAAQIRGLNWTQLVNQALQRGAPVLAGVPDLSKLKDTSGQATSTHHVGHGFTIVGVDASGKGYLTVDPNTPGTGFTDYTPQALANANLSTLIIPNQAPAAVQSANSATGGLQAFSAPAGNPGGPIGLPGSSAATAPGGGLSLFNFDPSQFWSALFSGAEAQLGDLAIRGVLILLGIVLLVVALIAFFFAGSGRTVAGEGAKAGAKAAATAAFA